MLRIGVSSFAYGPDYYGLGLTLGNGEMRLLELANAYAALARLGEFQPYRFLVREKAVAPTRTRVFSKETAFLIADMLADNPARAVAFGLDSQLHFDFPVACKTGTSSDYRDNWTLGFTPEFTVGVWVGRPDGAGMQGVSGVSGAAPVFHAVMEHLHSTRGTTWFEQPASVRPFFVDPRTGRSAPPGCTHGVWEKCASEPEAPRSADYDALGRVRLPGEYGEWLASRMNPRGAEWAPAEHGDGLCVLEPLEGTVLFLDPDIPVRSQTLALRAAGAGVSEQVWDCATAPVVVREGGARLELRAGVHVVRVRDSRTQREAQTWVEVRPL
jgi:penicillin-binding protein 1C